MQLRSAQPGQVQRDGVMRHAGPQQQPRPGSVRHPQQLSPGSSKQAPASVRTSSPPLVSNDTRSPMLDPRGVPHDRSTKKPPTALNSSRAKVGFSQPYQAAKNNQPCSDHVSTFLAHPNGMRETNYWEEDVPDFPRAPSEAPSSAAHSSGHFGVDVERLSAEDRIRRLENSLNERLVKSSSEAMNASLTLCKAAEDRLMQKMETFRREVQKDLAQALQVIENNAERRTVYTHDANDMQQLKEVLMNDLQEALGQEFAHLRLELAARGVPVMAGLPASGELDSLAQQGQCKKTGIAGLVGVISDCVVEKVKEDQSLRIASDQHEQLKEVIKELRDIPVGKPAKEGFRDEFDSLRSMVKESLNISYALAKELSVDREQKGPDLTAVTQRLQQEISKASRPRSSSLTRPSQPVRKDARSPSITSDSSLDRVVNGLQRLVHPQDESKSRSPRATPTNQSRSASHGSTEDGNTDFGSEVQALRSRLENIFHIGGSSETESIGTGSSTGYSGTFGSLPTVQESSS